LPFVTKIRFFLRDLYQMYIKLQGKGMKFIFNGEALNAVIKSNFFYILPPEFLPSGFDKLSHRTRRVRKSGYASIASLRVVDIC
jgi:hypothetical protein